MAEMESPKKLWVVVLPDGRVPLEGFSILSADDALWKVLRDWFPEHLFGPLKPGSMHSYGLLREVWPGMKLKGWHVHEIDFPKGLLLEAAGT